MSENYDTLVDEASSTITYVGKAARLSLTSAAVWQIKRIDTGTLAADVSWADGSDKFEKIWDDRATYSY